jgi:hypothetical protein
MSPPVRVPHSPRGYVVRLKERVNGDELYLGHYGRMCWPNSSDVLVFDVAYEAEVVANARHDAESVYSLAAALDEWVGEREGRG